MTLTEIIQTAEAAAPWILGVLIATTALAHALVRAARAFHRYALTTPSTLDDEVGERAVRFSEAAASVLEGLAAILPRIGVGRVPTVPPQDPPRRGPPRRGPPYRDALVALLVAGGLVLGAGVLQGCGSKADQHRTLNWITRVGDPSYELVVQACDEMRDYVVDREGHTEEEDRTLMGEINGVCDRAVASFEVLIHTQHGARAAIEAGVEGVAVEAVARALAIWRELQAVVDGIEVRNARTAGGEA